MIPILRRAFLLGSAAAASARLVRPAGAETPPPPVDLGAPLTYPFVLPPLPYADTANMPSIDAETMRLHHDRHHAAYVANLNAALKDHGEWHGRPLPEILARWQELPDTIRTAVRNNGGGHANHTMFWQVMGGRGGAPAGNLAAAVTRDFGGLDPLKAAFDKAAAGVFGSGWALVLVDRDGALTLTTRANQDSPLMDGRAVLFGNDVWEHAYYLQYQNRRADYLKAWWSVLDWDRIAARYAAVRSGADLV